MRAVKPMKVGFLTRPFEFKRQAQLSVATLIGFRFDGSVRLMTEMDIWRMVGDELGDQAVIDEGMAKSRAEMLIRGNAFVPGGLPATTCPVAVRVGALEKTLYVIGDRFWNRGVPTEPRPFTSMQLDWAHAYGGEGYPRNPLGKGHAPITTDDGATVHPLPNVELPSQLITSPKDQREPAGFMPFGFDWPQRREGLGTYDERWIREDFPGYARDIDWQVFNAGASDQRQEHAFVGNEAIECLNLHPTKPKLTGQLPNIRTRAFIAFKAEEGRPLHEVALRLTTVWLFPHLETGVAIAHGVHAIAEDDAYDVEGVLLAAENIGQPRPVEHYQRLMDLSLQKDPESALPIVSGVGLVPDDCVGVEEMDREVAAFTPEGLLLEAQFRGAKAQHEEARQQLVAAGMDPSLLGPPPAPPEDPPKIEDLGPMLEQVEQEREELEKKAAREREEMENQARAVCDAYDLNYDEVFKKEPGPPPFDAARELAKMEGALANSRMLGQPLPEQEKRVGDPAFRERLFEAERQLREAYRLTAHHNEADPTGIAVETLALRKVELLELIRAGESAAHKDFTGVDLAGEDLQDADLAGAFMERANLEGCDLRRADLSGAVLAGANLDRANLTGAKLAGTNLGKASLRSASYEGDAELTGTVLDEIDATGARLHGVKLEDHALLRECNFENAELCGWKATGVLLYKCKLRGASLARGRFDKAGFAELDATDLVATGADLRAAMFYEVRAPNARMDHAQLTNFRAVGNTVLAGVDLTASTLIKANLRGVDLRQAQLAGCDVSEGDMSEADLTGANLEGLVAVKALLVRTNFTDANLRRANLREALVGKANLTGADLRDSSLFGADLSRARSDGGTNLGGSDQTRARIHPRREPT